MVCLLPSHWLVVVYWWCVCYLHTDWRWYIEIVFVTFTLTCGGILRVCMLPSHWLAVVYWGCVCYLHTDLWWYIVGELVESLLFVTFTLTGDGILRVNTSRLCSLSSSHWQVVVYWRWFVTLTLIRGGILRACLLPWHWLVVVYWGWFVTFRLTGSGTSSVVCHLHIHWWCYIEVEALFGWMKISVACPTGKVVISFFLLTVFFNSSIRFWVTVTGFVLRFHNCNISFLLHHQTDWLQCRSMWLACQCS